MSKTQAKKKPSPVKNKTKGTYDVTITGTFVDPDAPIPYRLALDTSGLPDSGTRHNFSTGSVRDQKSVNDGRYDLIPAECLLAARQAPEIPPARAFDCFLAYLAGRNLAGPAIYARALMAMMGGAAIATQRLAVLYAKGAIKYDARNWEKGQETGRYIDSAQRHEFKYSIGDTSEDHLAAALWNVLGLMWTVTRIKDGRLPKTLDTYGLVKS